MFTKSYDSAIQHAAELCPSMDTPSKVFAWIEDIVSLICFIYGADYDDVTEQIIEAAKEAQDWEDDN